MTYAGSPLPGSVRQARAHFYSAVLPAPTFRAMIAEAITRTRQGRRVLRFDVADILPGGETS